MPPKEVKLPAITGQTHRRFSKTHLSVDALVSSDKAKYIYVGRDARDVVWSLHNHQANANDMWYDALNKTPGRVRPEIGTPTDNAAAYFAHWLDSDGSPFWPYWENVRSWWKLRDYANVKLIHFADLKKDLSGQIAEIADFLDIDVAPDTMGKILHHCSFGYMKENASGAVPLGGAFWDGGARTVLSGWLKEHLPDQASNEGRDAAFQSSFLQDSNAWMVDLDSNQTFTASNTEVCYADVAALSHF